MHQCTDAVNKMAKNAEGFVMVAWVNITGLTQRLTQLENGLGPKLDVLRREMAVVEAGAATSKDLDDLVRTLTSEIQ